MLRPAATNQVTHRAAGELKRRTAGIRTLWVSDVSELEAQL